MQSTAYESYSTDGHWQLILNESCVAMDKLSEKQDVGFMFIVDVYLARSLTV